MRGQGLAVVVVCASAALLFGCTSQIIKDIDRNSIEESQLTLYGSILNSSQSPVGRFNGTWTGTVDDPILGVVEVKLTIKGSFRKNKVSFSPYKPFHSEKPVMVGSQNLKELIIQMTSQKSHIISQRTFFFTLSDNNTLVGQGYALSHSLLKVIGLHFPCDQFCQFPITLHKE